MSTKAIIVNGEERSSPVRRLGKNPMSKFVDTVVEQWREFVSFLGYVRAEMRKVVTPSRKEVQATTTVVIIAVFIFGLFFFVVDLIFSHAMDAFFRRLGA